MNFKEESNDIDLEKSVKEFEEIEAEILELKNKGEAITFSKGLDEKMLQMIREFERIELKKDKKKKVDKYIRIAAMILLCITVSLAVVTVNVDAFRIKLFDFITRDHGNYMDLNIVEKGNISPVIKDKFPKEWDSVFYPMSLPEGYELVDVYGPGTIKGYVFSNKEKADTYICFDYVPINEGSTSIDSEKAEVGKTTINGKDAIYSEKEGHILLIWVQDGYEFSLDMDKGNLEEAKSIAESSSYIMLD